MKKNDCKRCKFVMHLNYFCDLMLIKKLQIKEYPISVGGADRIMMNFML